MLLQGNRASEMFHKCLNMLRNHENFGKKLEKKDEKAKMKENEETQVVEKCLHL